MENEIRAACSKNGIAIAEHEVASLAEYAKMLAECNARFNLTSITEPAEIASKHFADSILGAEFFPHGASCVDIGSGAGFPAIPLRVMRADLSFVLLDSLNKRVGFLTDVTRALGLANASAVHSRAEDYAKVGRGMFDVATARAVAPLATLAEYALPLLKIGGLLVVYKGKDVQAELDGAKNALRLLGGQTETVREYMLDGVYARSLIVVRKTRETPPVYPRGGDKPKRTPL